MAPTKISDNTPEVRKKLCDPDIDTLVLKGCTSPEPSIRSMIEFYYQQVFSKEESKERAKELIASLNVEDDF